MLSNPLELETASNAEMVQYFDLGTATDNRYGADVVEGYSCGLNFARQWWDALEQDNRPHGWAFSKINNGVIRDMKLWKVSSHVVRDCK